MSSRKLAGGLIPFGLIFLGVGVGFGFSVTRTLLRADAMRTWRETPAQVLECTLHVSHNSKGSSTYRVSASYRYEADGRAHTGTRVTLHSGSDNIGRFHHTLHAALDACRRNNKTTSCWVNPDDPTDAILIRTIRPERVAFFHLFVLMFGGVGLGVMTYGISLLTSGIHTRADGRIPMRHPYGHRAFVTVAIVSIGYIGWTLWLEHRVIPACPFPVYLWIPAVVGVLLAILGGYHLARFRRFGVSVLELSPATVVIGGPLFGTLRIPARLAADTQADLKLTCIRQYTTGSGKHRNTHRDVLWQEQTRVPAHDAGVSETFLAVRFSLPATQPTTTADGGCTGTYWQLTAFASLPGVDYRSVFDIPVRKP